MDDYYVSTHTHMYSIMSGIMPGIKPGIKPGITYAFLQLVEVKSTNDKLSSKQILWLDYLRHEAGLNAEVCHVQC